MLDHGVTWTRDIARLAARYGQVKILEWAEINGYDWKYLSVYAAARLPLYKDRNIFNTIVNWIEKNNEKLTGYDTCLGWENTYNFAFGYFCDYDEEHYGL